MSANFEKTGLATPFKGITTNGQIEKDLFAIRSTGVSTEPVRKAADAFLAALTPAQRGKIDVRRRRSRVAQVDEPGFLRPAGRELSRHDATAQRRVAIALLQAGLSAKGLKQTRDIMRLNHTLGEMERQRLRSVRRVALSRHGDGAAVADRAVGLAARRPPRDHQLLRARRSGGDDAVVRRIRAGDRADRHVQGHVRPAGRAESRRRAGQRAVDDPARRRSSTCRRPATRISPKPGKTTSCSTTPVSASSDDDGRPEKAAARSRSRSTSTTWTTGMRA